jgi:hypothetical protein
MTFFPVVVRARMTEKANGLTLSPALCGVLLGSGVKKSGSVNRALDGQIVRLRDLDVALVALTFLGFKVVPSGFIPTQDQGFLIMATQLPDSASLDRTEAVRVKVTQALREVPGIDHCREANDPADQPGIPGRLANHDAIAKTLSADTGGKICQYARPLPWSRSRAMGTDQEPVPYIVTKYLQGATGERGRPEGASFDYWRDLWISIV